MISNKIILVILIVIVSIIGWLVFVNARHQTIAYEICESITVGSDSSNLAQIAEQFPVIEREADLNKAIFEANLYTPAITAYLCEVHINEGKIVDRYLVEEGWL